MTMPRHKNDILQGTLVLLVLKSIEAQGRMHGYAVTSHIQRVSADLLRVEEGSLYPALQKLLVKGWVKATWRESDSGRQVREYRITAAGKQQLEAEIGEYRRMTSAIDVLLKEA